MKLAKEEKFFESNVTGKVFSIRASSKAMDILSGLYSNPEQAVLRELGTNAADSHKQAGKNIPFDVTLPTAENPTLIIQDYGTGIDPQLIESVYTVYFASTKDGSNDFNGCLGLGSKSIFTVTDQATIINIFDGVKYTYSVFKNDGIPNIALLGSEKTEDCNGLTTIIPVNPNKISTFVSEARKIYPYFEILPNVIGTQINHFTNYYTDLGHGVYSRKDLTGNSVRALMGNVLYPIDFSITQLQKYRDYFSAQTVIKFNIGELDIAPNREALKFDGKTINTIIQRLENYIDFVKAKIDKNLGDEPWEMARKFKKLTETFSAGIRKALFNKVIYKNKPLSDLFSFSPYSICYRIPQFKNYKLFVSRHKKYETTIPIANDIPKILIRNTINYQGQAEEVGALIVRPIVQSGGVINFDDWEKNIPTKKEVSEWLNIPENYIFFSSEIKYNPEPREKNKQQNSTIGIRKLIRQYNSKNSIAIKTIPTTGAYITYEDAERLSCYKINDILTLCPELYKVSKNRIKDIKIPHYQKFIESLYTDKDRLAITYDPISKATLSPIYNYLDKKTKEKISTLLNIEPFKDRHQLQHFFNQKHINPIRVILKDKYPKFYTFLFDNLKLFNDHPSLIKAFQEKS